MELEQVKKPNLPKTYSTEEVAKFMGVSYQTVYRLVKNGKIKAINVAQSGTKKTFRIRAEEIQAYYDSIQISYNGVEAVHE